MLPPALAVVAATASALLPMMVPPDPVPDPVPPAPSAPAPSPPAERVRLRIEAFDAAGHPVPFTGTVSVENGDLAGFLPVEVPRKATAVDLLLGGIPRPVLPIPAR
jgi:hypothetical protein